ncbi:uncharacterized protein LOC118437509 [Folsomia candida]|nr:uncharacterized protein LOC118437509 [Folsomia candida]
MSAGVYFHHGRPSGKGGSSPLMLGGYRQWRSWTSVDSWHENDHLSGSTEPSVRITLDKTSTTPVHNQISGVIELKRNETYCGVIVELLGFYTHAETSYPILPNDRCNIYQRVAGTGVKGETMTSRALTKFPFQLNLPPNCVLPATLKTKMGRQVQYYLRVSEERGTAENSQMGRKIILYGGRLPLRTNPCAISPLKKELSLDGVTVVLEIAKQEFLLGQSIPFTITSQGESSVVKRVKISLTRTISHSQKVLRCVEQESEVQISSESEVMDCLVFRRFLKRESFTRSGKLSQGKDPIPTFASDDEPHLRIRYVVEIKLTTRGHNVDVKQMEVIIGTEVVSSDRKEIEGASSSMVVP